MYVRKIRNDTLTFIVSGMLWRNSLIMQDKETGSYWSHITGEALLGELKEQRLSFFPVVQTTWSQWKMDHPDTKLLKKSREVRSSAYEDYFRDPNRTGLFRTNWLMERMAGKEMIHGITLGPHALAISPKRLKLGQPVQVELGDKKILIIRTNDGGARAYQTEIKSQRLSFDTKTENSKIRDIETGSIWNLETGVCIEGQLEGNKLVHLQVLDTFWFAWSSFYPNTRVLD